MRSLNEYLNPFPIIIEDIFLQVGLKEQNRDATRFFWIKKSTIQTYKFPRILFDIISSPFLSENTIQYHLGEYNSAGILKIKDDIYVDILVVGMSFEEDAIKLYAEFYLRSF